MRAQSPRRPRGHRLRRRPGLAFDDFLADAAPGWAEDLLLGTWDLRPFTPDADFLVAVLRPA